MNHPENNIPSYAIIGFGAIGKALAKAFCYSSADGGRLDARASSGRIADQGIGLPGRSRAPPARRPGPTARGAGQGGEPTG